MSQTYGAAEWADDPGIALFMTELEVVDWGATLAWYEQTLGLRVLLRDEPGQFALIGAGSGRLALKGTSVPGGGPKGVRLIFLVLDVDAEYDRLRRLGQPVSPPADHPREPYRQLRLVDPSGTPITLFSWRS